MVPGSLFTNECKLLFSLISLNDDVACIWRWGWGSAAGDDSEVDDFGRNATMFDINAFSHWTSVYPIVVLWEPGVHRSSR